MTPERWQQLDELYHAARERGLDVLADADPEVKRKVEALLAQDTARDGPLDRPAAEMLGDSGVSGVSTLAPGTRLGPYEIETPIGKGGMGEVYLARDTRLQRTVAIKVLSAHLSFSPDMQARFEQEAKSISRLQHPNICVVHDIGSQDGVDFMVMEYLDGQTLGKLIPPSGLATDLVLKYAVQIAEALRSAHAAGIVHRDLKPANIMVDKNGLVKVLDFGLAKLAAPASTIAAEDAATTAAKMTTPGMIVGTVAYMSPEQARARELDGRSDLFSFGAVLYEMATGVPAFRGESSAVIFKAILDETPTPAVRLNPGLPAEFEGIINKALEKDRDLRYRSATDMRSDLKRLERSSSATGAIASAPKAHGFSRYAITEGVAVMLGIVLLIAGGVFWWQRAKTKPLGDRDVLVLADFTNTTGDAQFDGALRQALAFDLEESPFLKIMDDEEVNQALQLMGRPAGQRITNAIAHEVCVREGQKATMGGSIASLGKTYQIALQAINCQTGATLARAQAEAEDKEHVVKAVAKAATGMRAKLGESLSSIQKPGRPLDASVTTASLDALNAYHLGYDLLARASPREAIPQFQSAIEMDPNFAFAYEMLGVAYITSGDPVRQRENYSKAFALADRVSERERLLISGTYYQSVTHEMDKAIDAFQVAARTYPRFEGPRNQLFVVYSSRGEYEKALEEEQEALRLAPRNMVFIGNLMTAYLRLDRFDDAKALAEKAFSQKLDGTVVHTYLLIIANIQDDRPAQDKELAWFAGKPEEYVSLRYQEINAMVHGQRRRANEIRLRADEVARRHGLTGAAPDSAAMIDAQVGDCEGARKDTSNPLLMLCGDAAAVRLAEERVVKNPPPNPDAANLLYLRGLVALNAGKGGEAAAEFQRILGHKALNWGPLYALAYLGLARGAALAGDTAKARKAYQDFLALWKDADPDIPALIAARKEFAALPPGK